MNLPAPDVMKVTLVTHLAIFRQELMNTFRWTKTRMFNHKFVLNLSLSSKYYYQISYHRRWFIKRENACVKISHSSVPTQFTGLKLNQRVQESSMFFVFL